VVELSTSDLKLNRTLDRNEHKMNREREKILVCKFDILSLSLFLSLSMYLLFSTPQKRLQAS